MLTKPSISSFKAGFLNSTSNHMNINININKARLFPISKRCLSNTHSPAKSRASQIAPHIEQMQARRHVGATHLNNIPPLTIASKRASFQQSNRFITTNSNLPHTIRFISFFNIGKAASRVSVFLGTGVAATGSYVLYKVEQASSFAQEQMGKASEMGGDIIDGLNGFFSNMFGSGENSNASSGGNENGNGDNSSGNGNTALGGTAAAFGLSKADEDHSIDDDDELEENEDDDENGDFDSATDDAILNLTRQMIEIRNILSNVDGSNSFKLPSIVVIGSQSSGKSSVLESIVGQEFLPKGSNMVTRRPIELTLVNDPSLAAEVAEFPALKISNMTDFQQVQKILFDLNMGVPQEEAISSDPIQLTIKSPIVPDLFLVDLPGYIQVEAADQPLTLKRKIRDLCNKYLEEPNIILAISAADVDLANSSALRAAKMSDPRGERTIGVITKLDLVDPETAHAILTNRKYPLKMGYVGVVTKAPASKSLFSRRTGVQAFIQQQNFERQYFRENKDSFLGTTTGTRALKKKLMKVLERSMATSLKPMQILVGNELEETKYVYKVEFNDRDLTSEKYMAQTIDNLKLLVKEFNEVFGRSELKSLLRNELDQKVLDILAEKYWNKPYSKSGNSSKLIIEEPDLADLSKSSPNDNFWHRKLDMASSSLTKLGVGRLSTTLVTEALLTEIDTLVGNTELRTHPLIKEAIRDAASTVLSLRYNSTSDQVENCIKPYKYEIEIEDTEWSKSSASAKSLIEEEKKQCRLAYEELRKTIGGKKVDNIMNYLENENNSIGESLSRESFGFSPGLLQRGREAIFLKDRLAILEMRSRALNSKQCKSKDNKYKCPEIFLDAVAEKLTQTAVLFLNVELLSDFYYSFPRELEKKLTVELTQEQIERFAKEDPKVKRHIELQERKELLELALSKIDDVMALQKSMSPRLLK